jgi:putative restriction endonuclease
MTKEELLRKFGNLSVWEKEGRRAPHKPLMVLLALANLQKGNRWLRFKEIDRHFKDLLMTYGRPSKSYHPEYPFWWLQSDGIWEVHEGSSLRKREGKSAEPLRSEFIRYNTEAGFSQEVTAVLQRRPEWIKSVAHRLMDSHFPESLHQEIVGSVGLELEKRGALDAGYGLFRETVLRAYQHRCAICGYDLKLGCADLGLDAAHIKWRAAEGPDSVNNGLSLCVLHHKAFDLGAITLTLDYKIMVSEHVHGSSHLEGYLLEYLGKAIMSPQKPVYLPQSDFIKWHQQEVFRAPSR